MSLRHRWRHQLPAYSPMSLAALIAGARAAFAPGASPERLRALLTRRFSASDLVLTDSGTSALAAALAAVVQGRPTRAAVALPAYSCYDVGTAAEAAGVRVIFYDLDPHTLAPDPASLATALERGAGAVVVVHLYGYPVDVHAVTGLADAAGAVVIEDAAQAAGGTLRGRPAGTDAPLTVLSFARGKGLTGGGGGALLARGDAGLVLLDRVRAGLDAPRRGWRDLARAAAQLVWSRPGWYGLPASLPFLRLGETVYREPRRPARASAVSGAVVAELWRAADRELERRRRNALRLLTAVARHPALRTVRVPAGARPGVLRLPLVGDARVRALAATPEARRLGIMPGYPRALPDVARLAARCVNPEAPLDGARYVAARLCTLPTHGRLAEGDLRRLEAWLARAGAGDAPPEPGARAAPHAALHATV